MKTANGPTHWNLNKFYDDFDEDNLIRHLLRLKETLNELELNITLEKITEKELATLSNVMKQIEKADSFYYCLTIENIDPAFLTSFKSSITLLKSKVHSILSDWQQTLNNMTKEQVESWSNSINEKDLIAELVSNHVINEDNYEKMITNFSKETLNGLEDIYSQLCNNIIINVDSTNKPYNLSFFEAINLSMSHVDYEERQRIFDGLNSILERQSTIFASIYNQMIGTRTFENEVKNVDYLEESLKKNGISQPILNTMWHVVDCNLDSISTFFKVRAKETKKEKISWYELMSASPELDYQMNYTEAINGIVRALEIIDINMAKFVENAVKEGWVDAVPSNTKPASGFCVPFMIEEESRISLNFNNSIESARILAHELGHAWHYYQIKNKPSLRFLEESFEMTTAETASIFFETVFIDFVIQDTKDSNLKKALLGWKIERSLNYLMSIRGAFLLENKVYEERKKRVLSAKQIEELSMKCQKEVYGNSLSEYQPFVWMKYGQFYQADTTFYNYPYSFGFLLSIGLLETTKEDKQFSKNFQVFLSETGQQPVEKLIKKYFNTDLSRPDFWQQSMQRIIEDIEQYSKF